MGNENWFRDLFINEAKPGLRHHGGGSGGDGLPEATEADNNKILTVENGEAAWKEPLAYVEKETEKIEVFPQTTLEFEGTNGYGYVSIQPISLTDGKEYTVAFDGVEYKCIAEVNAIIDEARLGNVCVRDDVDGGVEPFFYNRFEDLSCGIWSRTAGAHTIEIYYTEVTETIVPIDPKYLPEGGVGYIERGYKFAQKYTDNENNGVSKFPNNIIRANGTMCKLVAPNGDESIATVTDRKLVFEFDNEYGEISYWWDGLEGCVFVDAPSLPSYTAEGTTFSVYIYGEVIHPIDQKFLPGGSIPMVELTTRLATGVTLTEEESAALTAVYDSELPVAVIKAPIAWGNTLNWDTAFIVEKGVLSQGWEILTARVGSMRGTTYRIEFERSSGLWSVTVEEIKADNGGIPVVDLNVAIADGMPFDMENSGALNDAHNTGMPVVIKAKYFDDEFMDNVPITAVFQNYTYDTIRKLTAQVNNSNVVLENNGSSWFCSVTT